MTREQGGRPGRERGHLALLSVGALGVVYGDIGTSPLYAFREAIHLTGGRAADEVGILGILSMILWSLVAIVTVKYLGVVMRADNHGEGGILALTALVVPRSGPSGRRRWFLVLLGLFGTGLLYGDGIITPAISVLAAVEGLELAAPTLAPLVVPAAVAILIGLFVIQHFGTAKVGAVFGPVMATWFVTLAVLGVWNVFREPAVLAAINPAYAVRFFATSPSVAFLALGGVFLVVTGTEALYADMGHFGKRPIQLGWFTVVLPALLANYFGQGALLLADPTAAANPFYLMAPGWAQLPLVVLATLATVIASQALITGAFSLTMQAVQLGYLPRMDIAHTSPREFGQVYLPTVNLALAVACVALVLGFRSSSGLAAAYGVAVASTMVLTTLLLIAVARERWGWSRHTTAVVTGVFLTIDLVFFTVNIIKIPAGGWLPLVLGGTLFAVMTTWHHGRRQTDERRRHGSGRLQDLLAQIAETDIPRVPGTAIYLSADPDHAPGALSANLDAHQVLHEHIYLVSVTVDDHAYVPLERRAHRTALHRGITQITLTFGFMEEPDVPEALRHNLPENESDRLEDAVYFVGRETIVATAIPGMAPWRERLFILLHRNATSAVHYFRLPRDRIIVVGSVIEI